MQQLRIITKEELLELYKYDKSKYHRIMREEEFRAPKAPYFTQAMYRYLGTKTTSEIKETANGQYWYNGYYWDRDWLIPIGLNLTPSIDKDMVLKLI